MTATDWVQAIAMVVLVVVTIFYAYQAKKARDSAEASAQASKKMAEETKKQRYSESLPLLVPSIPPVFSTDELPYESLQSGIGMKVIWRNAGKGAAINSRFSFYPAPLSLGKAEFFPSHALGTLEVGGKKEVDFEKIFERYWRQTKLLNVNVRTKYRTNTNHDRKPNIRISMKDPSPLCRNFASKNMITTRGPSWESYILPSMAGD